jgi:sulfur carrier protein ThiS
MQIKLVFTTHFRQMLGLDEAVLRIAGKTTVGDAIRTFLAENPEHRATLENRKSFLMGELRAIYSINGKAVKADHQLKDRDEIKILKAFIGG